MAFDTLPKDVVENHTLLPIPEKDWARYFIAMGIGENIESEFRQIPLQDVPCVDKVLKEKNKNVMAKCKIIRNKTHGVGLMICTFDHWVSNGIYDPNSHWETEVMHYKFKIDEGQCDHDWDDGKTIGRCYREFTCKKCGETMRIDSSD